jgi:hypothetical protein
MTDKPTQAAPQPGPDARRDPVQVLVDALGELPEADRDLVYTWLLRHDFEAGTASGLTASGRSRAVSLATLLQSNPALGSGALLTQASGQQMVPVRFSSDQHARLRQWCSEHGFSMATVIRGLVARFLEGQLPGAEKPA